MKLDLQLGESVQGEVAFADKNLMLVFQVNCPGCLSRALPLLIKIKDTNPDVNCFALSTAFEDFALNNVKTTQSLLTEGELPLNSKRYFAQIGHQKLPYAFDLPVVMDWVMPVEAVAGLAPAVVDLFNTDRLSSKVEDSIKKHFSQRLLPMAKTGRTFLNNDFQGTPTWVYFNRELEILETWFGHKDYEWITAILKR